MSSSLPVGLHLQRSIERCAWPPGTVQVTTKDTILVGVHESMCYQPTLHHLLSRYTIAIATHAEAQQSILVTFIFTYTNREAEFLVRRI